MPKIIPEIRTKITSSARRLLSENGFTKLNLRDVAADCGIAVGTIYNYFPSKAALATDVISSDWEDALGKIRESFYIGIPAQEFFSNFYHSISDFQNEYWNVFNRYSDSDRTPDAVILGHDRMVSDIVTLLEELEKVSDTTETYEYNFLVAQILMAVVIHGCAEEAFMDLVRRVYR